MAATVCAYSTVGVIYDQGRNVGAGKTNFGRREERCVHGRRKRISLLTSFHWMPLILTAYVMSAQHHVHVRLIELVKS